jgi:uncharacterized membrane protein
MNRTLSTTSTASIRSSQSAFVLAIVLGCLWLALGVWALAQPESFYSTIAPFVPYNRHLVHDLGAFQIGLGAALLLAARWSDGLIVAFGANVFAGSAHVLSHVLDSQLGGHSYDIPNLILLVLLPLAGLVLRARAIGRPGPPPGNLQEHGQVLETSTGQPG